MTIFTVECKPYTYTYAYTYTYTYTSSRPTRYFMNTLSLSNYVGEKLDEYFLKPDTYVPCHHGGIILN